MNYCQDINHLGLICVDKWLLIILQKTNGHATGPRREIMRSPKVSFIKFIICLGVWHIAPSYCNQSSSPSTSYNSYTRKSLIIALKCSPLTVILWPPSFWKEYGPMIPFFRECNSLWIMNTPNATVLFINVLIQLKESTSLNKFFLGLSTERAARLMVVRH